MIGPHAGYTYSGPVLAWAYRYMQNRDKSKPLRIFLMGPCHRIYMEGIGLSPLKVYKSPLGDVELDIESKS